MLLTAPNGCMKLMLSIDTYLLTMNATVCYVYWILEFKPVLVLRHPFFGFYVIIIIIIIIIIAFSKLRL
jgi:hypothetical protein